MEKSKQIIKDYYTIGEASSLLNIDQHVIRFWTTQFSNYIKPIRKAGLRRYYSNEDIKMLEQIKEQLYTRGLSIRGVQLLLEESNNLNNKIIGKNKLKNINKNNSIDSITNEINNALTILNNMKTKINNFINKDK